MKYVLTYETSPDRLDLAMELFGAHQEAFQRYQADGTLLMIGPWSDPREGAMAIFTTREAAESFVAEDPFVTQGVISRWTVREWDEAIA